MLGLAGVLVFGLALFLVIAANMAGGEIRPMDEKLFLLLREPGNPENPLGPVWLAELALEITAIGGYPLIVLSVAAVAGLFLIRRQIWPAVYLIASVSSAALLSGGLKAWYSRPRPDLAGHLDIVHTTSFPSGHALVTTVTYLVLASLAAHFFKDRRIHAYLFALAILLAGLVGISRVYLGVHWPSDVAAGWALGAAWASLCWLAAGMFWRRGEKARRERSEPQDAGGEGA